MYIVFVFASLRFVPFAVELVLETDIKGYDGRRRGGGGGKSYLTVGVAARTG